MVCTENSFTKFCFSCTYQTGKSDDFSFSYVHRNIFYTILAFGQMIYYK